MNVSAFVALCLLTLSPEVSPPADAPKTPAAPTPAEPARRTPAPRAAWTPIGRFASAAICEASGLAKSSKHDGIFWTHNDSGNPAELFAVRLTGEIVARIPIAGATNTDWEDLASDGKGRIFIGDIGDNFGQYPERVIYELEEPDPFATPVVPAKPARVWKYSYPDAHYDCEALFVYDGKLHVLTKALRGQAVLFRLEPGPDDRLAPQPVCNVPVWAATGADVSPDGKQLALVSYGRLYVFDLDADLSGLDHAQPRSVAFPFKYQTEACAFDGTDVIIAAESRELWRITAEDIKAGLRFVKP